jgi:serine/threonine protein kinase
VGGQGYDGAKADAWSAGVIMYAMLVGSLPFGKELSQCPRFQRFRRWVAGDKDLAVLVESADCPPWLFPQHIGSSARSLMVNLLHPDPHQRLSIEAAQRHPWFMTGDAEGRERDRDRDREPSVHTGSVVKALRNLDLSAPGHPQHHHSKQHHHQQHHHQQQHSAPVPIVGRRESGALPGVGAGAQAGGVGPGASGGGGGSSGSGGGAHTGSDKAVEGGGGESPQRVWN